MTTETLEKPTVKSVNRMEIWMADLRGLIGSEQSGIRPVLISQNSKGNQYAPTTIIIPITTSETKTKLPTHVYLSPVNSGLTSPSICLAEQVRTIDKGRLMYKMGKLDLETMRKVDWAIIVSQELEYLFEDLRIRLSI